MISHPLVIQNDVGLQELNGNSIPYIVVDANNFDLSQLNFYDDDEPQVLLENDDTDMLKQREPKEQKPKGKKCGVWCKAVQEHLN